MHHGTALRIGTHYTDTGGASDHVFILCAMLGFRFCPRLRDFPDRKFACIEPAATYKNLQPLFGRRIRTDVIHDIGTRCGVWLRRCRQARSCHPRF
jgi:TnpA family transposase